jgi:hypothetical protein
MYELVHFSSTTSHSIWRDVNPIPVSTATSHPIHKGWFCENKLLRKLCVDTREAFQMKLILLDMSKGIQSLIPLMNIYHITRIPYLFVVLLNIAVRLSCYELSDKAFDFSYIDTVFRARHVYVLHEDTSICP